MSNEQKKLTLLWAALAGALGIVGYGMYSMSGAISGLRSEVTDLRAVVDANAKEIAGGLEQLASQETVTPAAASTAAQHDVAPAGMSAFAHEPVYVEHVAAISRTPPEYPAYAQDNGLEGFVELEFVVQRNGRVDDRSIRVINARPERVFDDSARDAIARWQFEPGQQPRRATQRLTFRLR